MKMTKISVAILASSLLIASCKKSEQVLDPSIQNNPSGSFVNQLGQLFEDNENDIIQDFVINADNWQFIQGAGGTKIQFQPSSFETKSGQSVTGNVTIQLVEIFDKANMVLLNKATNGKLGTGETSTLVSGGEIKVVAYQGTEELVMKDGKAYYVTVPSSNTGGIDYNMNLFEGVVETGGDIMWLEEEDTIAVVQDSAIGGSWGMSYSWSDSAFGWTNIDRFYSDPRPKTEIYVEVPQGYDKSNCEVFLSYDGEATALASFDMYDATTKRFTEHYGLIPIGLEVHFIFVTEKDGKILATIQGATITNGHVEVIGSPVEVTKAQITADILGLP